MKHRCALSEQAYIGTHSYVTSYSSLNTSESTAKEDQRTELDWYLLIESELPLREVQKEM